MGERKLKSYDRLKNHGKYNNYSHRFYRYRSGNHMRDNVKLTGFSRRIVISLVFIITILILKNINVPFVQRTMEKIRSVVACDFDIERTLGKLKFVESYVDDVKSVFAHLGFVSLAEKQQGGKSKVSPVFIAPAEGKVAEFFCQGAGDGGEYKNNGIDILSSEPGWIYAVADGTVTAIGKDEESREYVKIDHGNGLVTMYGGICEEMVSAGQQVRQGDRIGKMKYNGSGQYVLHFEVWSNGHPVDPLPFIQEENKVFR